MPIIRERLMRYKTSDGRPWDSYAEALAWEKRLILGSCLLEKGVPAETAERAVEALLAYPGLIIALSGPLTAKPLPRQQELLP